MDVLNANANTWQGTFPIENLVKTPAILRKSKKNQSSPL